MFTDLYSALHGKQGLISLSVTTYFLQIKVDGQTNKDVIHTDQELIGETGSLVLEHDGKIGIHRPYSLPYILISHSSYTLVRKRYNDVSRVRIFLKCAEENNSAEIKRMSLVCSNMKSS